MAADGGDEGGSGDVAGEEMGLGAGAGEEWSGVPNVSVVSSCRESERENGCSGVGEDAVGGLGGSGNRAGGGL